MPVSIREQLLAAITTAVGGKYGVPAPEEERDLPVTIVQDGDDTVEPTAYGTNEIEMPVAIERTEKAVSNDRTAMRTQANEMLAQIEQLMFADETFGGLSQRVDYTNGGIGTEAATLCNAAADFVVTYQTKRGDPYTINTD